MDDFSTTTYEQAFSELSGILEQLEGDGLTLAECVTLFERGRRLAAFCQRQIDAAELRVSQLGEDGSEQPL
jgi:exodeoxyribonuclease VII small subunit